MKNRALEIDDWKYNVEIGEHDQLNLFVKSPKFSSPPNSLYKLTTVSDWSVEAFENSYLYGTHPTNFNDLFDCHKDLVQFDCPESRSVHIQLLTELYKEDISILSEFELTKRLNEARFDIAYSTFGLVCMTPKPDNILMWAYYGNNKGFMLEYDYTQFPSGFHGPFPINYLEELNSVSLKDHGDRVSILYQSLIKSKQWEHENEWRFLCRSTEGKFLIPFGVQESSDEKIHDRKFNYPESAVKSITLGNRFFSFDEMKINDDDVLIVVFKNEDDTRIKILDLTIARKLEIRIAMEQSNLMKIDFKACSISKKSKVEYHFKGL
jgi:hypothetical protein